jgi:NAD-dependent deacetylase
MTMKKMVVLTGAGISAESGLRTFRDMGGLWEQYDVMQVASIDGWYKNPELMINFYNDRRHQLEHAEPNAGHIAFAELEKYFDVTIITQNVDNLHERAGSTKIIHLHGELTKIRSSKNENEIIDIGYNDLHWGDKSKDGSQLRPYIVWFGEAVPMIEPAAEIASQADIFVVAGTSLNVYPAAGLIDYIEPGTPVFLIDPNEVYVNRRHDVTVIKENASVGVPLLKDILISKLQSND